MRKNTNPYDYPFRRIYQTFITSVVLMTGGWLLYSSIHDFNPFSLFPKTQSTAKIQPLVMKGGDPYIRALMRTITASEANVSKPYHVLYGGQYVSNLDQHPDICIRIVTGPNQGNCTTAAGRYQFLNTTWASKAKRYHPNSSGLFWWKSYSFEPEYQDKVVYRWLSDPKAWGVNISQLLQAGKIEEVLRLLSGTWTSLGYGIETNSMSSHLPKIYQQMLQEEL
ncbi:glycoside hydrolase family protein [Crocosphaera sp. UHCC 0190]|uniref:glycoside hydrolase family 24 protein n=1 Tax=Crocosphaera sp. UHCC 0190 TaxID=3110246 RepID=UPI002B206B99|nr:glycoside hydrolase family protein [Crocosphaera sp. UHCC 0190]MEA5509001.1 glycoside hydrolase family protein [Crocosphaera sp. UHCC 0190]